MTIHCFNIFIPFRFGEFSGKSEINGTGKFVVTQKFTGGERCEDNFRKVCCKQKLNLHGQGATKHKGMQSQGEMWEKVFYNVYFSAGVFDVVHVQK